MSIDFSLTERFLKVNLTNLSWEEEEKRVFDINITHNLTPMWDKSGCYDAIYMSEGKKAQEIIPFIERALKKMQKNKNVYIKIEPDNKWGTYEGALKFLINVLIACQSHPLAIINICK